MKRSVGIFLSVLLAAITIYLVLWIWGVVEINFLGVMKSGASFLILGGAAILFLFVYAIFFWKGNQYSLREQREMKERQNGQRADKA